MARNLPALEAAGNFPQLAPSCGAVVLVASVTWRGRLDTIVGGGIPPASCCVLLARASRLMLDEAEVKADDRAFETPMNTGQSVAVQSTLGNLQWSGDGPSPDSSRIGRMGTPNAF